MTRFRKQMDNLKEPPTSRWMLVILGRFRSTRALRVDSSGCRPVKPMADSARCTGTGLGIQRTCLSLYTMELQYFDPIQRHVG